MNANWCVYLAVLSMFGFGLLLAGKGGGYRRFSVVSDWQKAIGKISMKKLLRLFVPITAWIEKKKGERADMEIYEAISFLRNITILGQGRFLSADAIVEQLASKKGHLFPHYAAMLRLLRQNQKEAAVTAFAKGVGTKISVDYARLLIHWDDIDPEKLLETLLSYQISLKEMRTTVRKRRDEALSDLIYLPVVINVMLVFINFIYVGYFIDQKDYLLMML